MDLALALCVHTILYVVAKHLLLEITGSMPTGHLFLVFLDSHRKAPQILHKLGGAATAMISLAADIQYRSEVHL
jgi:hypothetical protein